MKLSRLLKLLFIGVMIGSCTNGSETGNGIEETKTIGLSEFDGISYDMSDDLIIKEGDAFEVKLIGDSNILDNVDLEIKNGVLFIDLMPGSYNNINLKVEVTLKALKSFENTGSGDVFIESRTDNTEFLKLISDGSGKIHVYPQPNLQELQIKIDGSGDLIFEGETSVSKAYIATDGSGDMNAYSLSIEWLDFYADGSGDLYLSITDKLVGTIEGNGNIYYIGSPQIEVIFEGSGELINKN